MLKQVSNRECKIINSVGVKSCAASGDSVFVNCQKYIYYGAFIIYVSKGLDEIRG